MNPAELISDLRQRGIELWIEEGRLKCRAPAGTLSSEMKATLADRKEEFLAFLRREQIVESARRTLVPLIPEGRRPPLFAVPSVETGVGAWTVQARTVPF